MPRHRALRSWPMWVPLASPEASLATAMCTMTSLSSGHKNGLSIDAQQRKAAVAARPQPGLQTVARIGAAFVLHGAGAEGRWLLAGVGHAQQVISGDDGLAVAHAAVGQQQAQAGVVVHRGVEVAPCLLGLVHGVGEPGGAGLGAQRLPNLFADVLAQALARGAA